MWARGQRLLLRGVGALLAVVVSGCGPLMRRREPPPPPVVAPLPPPALLQGPPQTRTPDEHTVKQVGDASWYGPAHQGKETASGEPFNQHALTAAHPTLPLGTRATVTNLKTGQSVTVTINDRGPYVKGRKIDLSRAAAGRIGMIKQGVAPVKIVAKVRRKPPKRMRRRAAPRPRKRVARQETVVSRPVPGGAAKERGAAP